MIIKARTRLGDIVNIDVPTHLMMKFERDIEIHLQPNQIVRLETYNMWARANNIKVVILND